MTAVRTVQSARKVLDGIAEINAHEALVFGIYYQSRSRDCNIPESVCGGNVACLIGSAYVAAGAEAEYRWGTLDLLMLDGGSRGIAAKRYLKHRHGLRIALDALDRAALWLVDNHEELRGHEVAVWDEVMEDDTDVPLAEYLTTTQGTYRIAEALFEDDTPWSAVQWNPEGKKRTAARVALLLDVAHAQLDKLEA